MADVLSKEQRKRCMSHVRGKDTKPEVMVRQFLFTHGFRFRLHRKDLPGKPDIVLPKYKTVIFINGCFWHGHQNCKFASIPKTNHSFWTEKILRNQERDIANNIKIKQAGWRIITIWECQLKNHSKQKETLNSLISELR